MIRSLALPKMWEINLLATDQYYKYAQAPELLRKEALEKINSGQVDIIFIDEIQRLPVLLNEVQLVIDQTGCRFILTGSSSRKLKRGGANLLGGRAVQRTLSPFMVREIGAGFQLEDVLLYGSLPSVFGRDSASRRDLLNAYVHIYLKEEIQSEGLVRNIGVFSRFLNVAASQSGELLSYANVGRECHVKDPVIKGYFEILEDTLIGFRLEPWVKSVRKRLAAHPKFYLFDTGVTNTLNQSLFAPIPALLRGRLFEQFLVLETRRTLERSLSDTAMYFWRTNHQAEVDLLLVRQNQIVAAFEIKAKRSISSADFSGLRAFGQEHPKVPLHLICEVEHSYQDQSVHVLSWKDYLERLEPYL